MSVTVELIGPAGESVDLSTDPSLLLGTSPGLFGLPPVLTPERSTPALRHGSIGGTTKALSRPVTVPVRVTGGTQASMLAQVQRLAEIVDPTRGAGETRIRVTRPNGSTREIVGVYTAGLQPAIEHHETYTTTVELVFRCVDPWWTDVADVPVGLPLPVTASGNTSTGWDDTRPWDDSLPWNGWLPSQSGGTVTVDLDIAGTAPCFPDLTVYGPSTGVVFTNLTTGRRWEWTRSPYSTLTAGESVEFRLRERSVSVYVGGESRFAGFDVASRDLWPLEPGVNRVSLFVQGATTDTAAALLSYRHRWSTC